MRVCFVFGASVYERFLVLLFVVMFIAMHFTFIIIIFIVKLFALFFISDSIIAVYEVFTTPDKLAVLFFILLFLFDYYLASS